MHFEDLVYSIDTRTDKLKTNSLTFLILFLRRCRVRAQILFGSRSRLKYDDAFENNV